MKNKTMLAVTMALLMFGLALATPALAAKGSGSEGSSRASDDDGSSSNSGHGSDSNSIGSSNSGSSSAGSSGRSGGGSGSNSGSAVPTSGSAITDSSGHGSDDSQSSMSSSRSALRDSDEDEDEGEDRAEVRIRVDDDDKDLPDFEIRAFIDGNTTQAKVEVKFVPMSNNTNATLEQGLNLLKNLTKDEISNMLRIREKDIDLRNDAELELGANFSELELRFAVNSTSMSGIVDEIANKLASLTLQELKDMAEIEMQNDLVDEDEMNEEARIDIDAREGNSRVRIRTRGDATDILKDLRTMLANMLASLDSLF